MQSLLHQWSFSVWWRSHGVCSISGHSLSDDDPMESVPSVVILCLMTIPCSLFHQWSFSVWWLSHLVFVPSVVILCLMTIPWSLFCQWLFSVWWRPHAVCSISGHSLSDDDLMELFCQWSFSDDPIRILSSNRGNYLSNNDPMESLLQ